MSSSKNYDKQIYQHTELGKLEAKVKRFFNVKELSKEFTGSNGYFEVKKLRLIAEKKYNEIAEKSSVIEQKLRDEKKRYEEELEKALTEQLKKEVEILENFEKTFNS